MAEEVLDRAAPAPRRAWRSMVSRAFPPARLTWVALVVLGVYGVVFLRGLGIGPLLALPAVAALADLAFQGLRFDGLRIPDGALATGLFLALLLPPTVPLFAAGTVVVGAIGVKHVLRLRGRPVLNPAATGAVIGAFLFGMAPAWWVGLGTDGELLMLGLGALLIARSQSNWRLPATFFAVFAPFSIFMRFVLGAALAPKLLILGILDPATLFFGLYMVSEPRSAPRASHSQPVYAALVALGAAVLPAVLPSTGILLALLLANLGAASFRFVSLYLESRRANLSAAEHGGRNRRRLVLPSKARALEPPRWSIPNRVGTGVVLLIVVVFIASALAGPTATPSVNVGLPGHASTGGGSSSVGGPTRAVTCVSDNPSIAAQTLQYLHKALGPSVILSYDGASGATVFFDPVNHVTVTETDLFEDYGFAEFNGDDYAVSGCAP